MLSSLKRAIARRRDDEKGFTLIELMVVLLIMAILIAIAIPTYLGVRSRAQDRAAQSNLNTALVNADSQYANSNDYSTATSAALTSAEPSITFVSGAATAGNTVSVDDTEATSGQQAWIAGALSASSTCFYIMSVKQTTTVAGTSESPGTYYAKDTSGTCNASAPWTTAATWSTSSSTGWS